MDEVFKSLLNLFPTWTQHQLCPCDLQSCNLRKHGRRENSLLSISWSVLYSKQDSGVYWVL